MVKEKTFSTNGVLILSQDGIQKLHDGMKGDCYNVFGLHQVSGDTYSFHFVFIPTVGVVVYKRHELVRQPAEYCRR